MRPQNRSAVEYLFLKSRISKGLKVQIENNGRFPNNIHCVQKS